MAEHIPDWKEVQTETFKRWMNARLEPRNIVLEDITKDLRDGLAMIALIEIQTGEPFPKKYFKKCPMRIHCLNNIEQVMTVLKEDLGVQLVNVSATDIYDGNLKLILGLTWTMICKFQFHQITLDRVKSRQEAGTVEPVELVVEPKPVSSAASALLKWCNEKLAGYGIQVGDLKKSWTDGTALSALVHALNMEGPDGFDEALLPPKGIWRVTKAIEIAKYEHHVADVMAPEHLVSGADERSLMTYLAMIKDELNPRVPLKNHALPKYANVSRRMRGAGAKSMPNDRKCSSNNSRRSKLKCRNWSGVSHRWWCVSMHSKSSSARSTVRLNCSDARAHRRYRRAVLERRMRWPAEEMFPSVTRFLGLGLRNVVFDLFFM
eukprot:819584_1